jgi:hypothetical protein
MRSKIALITSLAALGAMLPAAAWAQDTAPAAAAPDAPPAPAPAEAPAAAPAPEAAPAAEVTAAAPAAWPGWVRVDSDLFGVQLWGGATAPLGDGLGLAFDAYLTEPFVAGANLAEFDIGPAITVGGLTLTPMIGAQFDWSAHTFAAFVPQFYAVGTLGPVYTELWLQYFNYNSLYKYRAKVNPAADNLLYLRFFADYKISDYVGVGPQIELTQDFTAKKMFNMPVGANVFFFQAGAASTFQLFLGYETKKKNFGNNALAGRLSFVHNF